MKILNYVFFILLTFSSSNVFGAWLAEPFFGFSFGSQRRPYISIDDNLVEGKGIASAPFFGIRTGYNTVGGLSIGVDLAMGSYSVKVQDPPDLVASIPEDEKTVKSSGFEKGVYLRYKIPQSILSLWATYIVSAELEQKTETTSVTDLPKGTVRSGSGYKFGFGIVRDWLSLNFEYKVLDLKMAELPSGAKFQGDTERRKTSVFMFGLSFPLVFFK